MRKILLGIVAILLNVSPAFCQVTAICPTCSQFVNQVIDDGKIISQSLQQLEQLQAQLQEAQMIYGTLTHVTSVSGAIGALGMLGIQNPLPVNPWAVQQLMSGQSLGGISGISSTIGGLYNQNWNSNHIYTNTNTEYGQTLQTNANSISGIQSLSQQLYQSMAQRIPLIQQLETEYGNASDPKTIMDLQARLQAEQAIVQSQQVQGQMLGTMANAQFLNMQQQQQEQRQQDIQTVLSSDPG